MSGFLCERSHLPATWTKKKVQMYLVIYHYREQLSNLYFLHRISPLQSKHVTCRRTGICLLLNRYGEPPKCSYLEFARTSDAKRVGKKRYIIISGVIIFTLGADGAKDCADCSCAHDRFRKRWRLMRNFQFSWVKYEWRANSLIQQNKIIDKCYGYSGGSPPISEMSLKFVLCSEKWKYRSIIFLSRNKKLFTRSDIWLVSIESTWDWTFCVSVNPIEIGCN